MTELAEDAGTGRRGDTATFSEVKSEQKGNSEMSERENLRWGDGATIVERCLVSQYPEIDKLTFLKRLRVSESPRPPFCASPVLGAIPCLLLIAACLLLASGCRQDMQDQPKMKPLRATSFFRDGLSSRPPVEGTIPRGFLHTDTEFFTGKKRASTTSPSTPASATTAQNGAAAFPDDLDVLPIPVTEEIVTRGRQRFEIFCSVCHGLTGNGDGMIVRRGFRRAASFHDDRLRQAPVGHFFDAITNGWGAMPSYAPQISVQDRWAIVAYIRALQLSQQNIGTSSPPPAPLPTPTSGGHQ